MEHGPIRLIDVRHRDEERAIAVWLIGDVLVDCGPAARVQTLLEELEGARPRVLALTHIHLDHAGAAGALVERFPDLEVWVHERGAPHLVDPSRLLASAQRLYGDEMDQLWGPMLPVPQDNVRVLRGGEQVGPLDVAYTPGHASHHVSYWHAPSRTALVGDVAGVRITPSGYIMPPTPPPDIDVEAWQSSIEIVRAWRPERLALTHFGLFGEVDAHLDRMSKALATVAERARTMSADAFVELMRAEIATAGDAGTRAGYNLGAPPDQSYAGLDRYWSRREVLR